MQIPNHTPASPLLQLGPAIIISKKVGRVPNVLNARQDVRKSDGRIALCPAERNREAFVFCTIPSSQRSPARAPRRSQQK